MDQAETELLTAVRDLARGPFTERATQSDREGAFSHANLADLRALGIPGMGIPKELGGGGLSAETHIRIVEEVAYGDGSTAVALNMHLLGVEALVGLPPFPRRNLVIEAVAKEGATLCGPISVPSGELDSRTSGLRVTEEGNELVINGRVGFASMSDGARFVIAVGTIDRGEGNEPHMVLAMPELDTPGIKVQHNWDAMGFRATASHDIHFEDARVPKADALVAPVGIIRAIMEATIANPALAASRARGALGIPAIWLGLSQAAFDFTLEYVGKRHGMLAGANPLFGPQGLRSQEPWAQIGVGNLDHWVSTGRVVLYDMVRRLGEPVESTQAFNMGMLRVIYHLRRMGEEVATGAMRVCGAHAYVRSRPLERIFRDLVGSNVMAWKTDQLQQTIGMGALGMPVTIGGPSPA
jgi:alkylation response protein AidB-like acyl-CoA dehydrogenase